MDAILRRNSLDTAAAKRRCLGYRRRILDISQQVGALHIAPAFSCTEITDVLMKQVNGETRGMFVLTAEPKELCIVLILGPIRMDQLSELQGLSGLSKLGDVDMGQKSKGTKGDKGDKGEK